MAVKFKRQLEPLKLPMMSSQQLLVVAATDVFGVVGMASKNQIKDNITEILRKEKLLQEE